MEFAEVYELLGRHSRLKFHMQTTCIWVRRRVSRRLTQVQAV